MDKRQLIDDIRRFNTTAQPEFLAQFQPGDLEEYLRHLQDAQAKQTRIASFVRRPRKTRLAS